MKRQGLDTKSMLLYTRSMLSKLRYKITNESNKVFFCEKRYPRNIRQLLPDEKVIGLVRIEEMLKELVSQGYYVFYFPIEARGLDMIAENETEIIGLEITNFEEHSYISRKRFGNMKRNLTELGKKVSTICFKKYRKRLVYNFDSNLRVIKDLIPQDLELDKKGKQDLPEYF